jgi:hypothetical protein
MCKTRYTEATPVGYHEMQPSQGAMSAACTEDDRFDHHSRKNPMAGLVEDSLGDVGRLSDRQCIGEIRHLWKGGGLDELRNGDHYICRSLGEAVHLVAMPSVYGILCTGTKAIPSLIEAPEGELIAAPCMMFVAHRPRQEGRSFDCMWARHIRIVLKRTMVICCFHQGELVCFHAVAQALLNYCAMTV